MALAVVAGATTRIRLLSAVTLLPLYPAALAAKMAAVLDDASGQRFCFGVGASGDYPPEFAALGVPVTQRGARTDEALTVIRRLFDQPRVTFGGRWTQLDHLGLQPQPARPGGPAIWVAGRTEAAMRRAGRFASVQMPYLYTPQRLAGGLRIARAAAAEAGRDPEALRGAEQIRQFQQAGADSVMLNLACPAGAREPMLRLVTEELLPALRPLIRQPDSMRPAEAAVP